MMRTGLLLACLLCLAACQNQDDSSPAKEPANGAQTEAAPAAAATVSDPHSYAQADQLRSRHLELDLVVDFERRQLAGTATLHIERLRPDASSLILDTRDLHIETVEIASADGDWLPTGFHLGTRDAILGAPLTIGFPAPATRVRIHYRTDPDASGLQWLSAEQTADRRGPFLFSQSQAIHARSWIPLQDTPSIRITYDAHLHTPSPLRALMSANNEPNAPASGDYRFSMPQPIPSYLMALAVGAVDFRSLGDRTGIYAEPSVIEAAAREFSDTQQMLLSAEQLYGAYRWGRYDLLILPPSFPYGGMENPRLTFATPTVIAGDKSLVSLIAHELAHSWSGNLVTNATWRDFWLNEGFTTYFTHRIMEAVYGQERSMMEQQLSAQALVRGLAELPAEQTMLAGKREVSDPDEAVGPIAYQKGALFLHNLEIAFGRDKWDRFLSGWFANHAFSAQTTEDFVAYLDRELIQQHPSQMDLNTVNSWIYQPGLPPTAIMPISPEFAALDVQCKRWIGGEIGADKLPTQEWNVLHWQHFLDNLPEDIAASRLAELDRQFALSQSSNAIILRSWLLKAIPAGHEPAQAAAKRLLSTVGRIYLVAPVYRALAQTDEGLSFAREIYAQARDGYHPITRTAVEAILDPTNP